MKGSIISVIEVMLTGIILILAFYYFFPQYVIRTKWDRALLSVKVMDVLKTIDDLNRTYEFAMDTDGFNNFMGNVLRPEYHGAMVWWKETNDLGGYTEDMDIPYFTQGYKETIVDVENHPYEYTVDSNTVALWHFNDESGTTTEDESLNNNDGRLINMEDSDWVIGRFGTALHFDGTNEYVNVSDHPSLRITDYLTMELWFKTDARQSYKFLLERENTAGTYLWGLYMKSNSTIIQVYIRDSIGNVQVASTGGIWNDSQWHHFVGTFDGRYIRLYVDGNLKNTRDWSSTHIIASDPGSTYIGAWPGNNQYFNGTIDEVRILNRVLSGDEVKANFLGRYDAYSFTLGLGYPY